MIRMVCEQLVDEIVLLGVVDLQQVAPVVLTLGVGLYRGVPGAVVDVVQVVVVPGQCLGVYAGQCRGSCWGSCCVGLGRGVCR